MNMSKQTLCAGFLSLAIISLPSTSLAVTVEEVPNPRQVHSTNKPTYSANETDSSAGVWVLIGLGTLIGFLLLLIRASSDDDDGGGGGYSGSSSYYGGYSGDYSGGDSSGGGYSGGDDCGGGGGYSGGGDCGSGGF